MKLQRNNQFTVLIDSNPYPKGGLKVTYSGNNISIRDAFGVIYDNVSYTSITNGDTNVAFASIAELQTFVTNNFFLKTPLASYSASTFMTASTSGTNGATFVAFANQLCDQLCIENNTSYIIEVQKGGTGNTLQIQPGSSRLFGGISNANQLAIRRLDQTATTVTVQAEAITI